MFYQLLTDKKLSFNWRCLFLFGSQIDLKNADPARVEKQIEKVFDIPTEECIRVSVFWPDL